MASVNVSNGANGSPSTSPTTCVPTKLNPDIAAEEEDSLQQLIESELALRCMAATKDTPPDELLVSLHSTDFFSTTQYESPSEEVPPVVEPFDPFTTTVMEQSPTFTGFSEDELKEFNQDPFCTEELVASPTNETSKSQSNGTGIPTDAVDLLSGLEPTDSINFSTSPPPSKEITCDLVQDLTSQLTNNNHHNGESLEPTLQEDPIQSVVDDDDATCMDLKRSPSPTLDVQQQLDDIEEVEDILESKPEQIIDPITQTFDLSPTPPLDSQDNKEKIFPGVESHNPEPINSFDPIKEDPINKTIDLSPSPPVSDKLLKDFEEAADEIILPIVDPLNQTIDMSPSPPAADTLPDETSSTEVTEILQDPMYQTYDLSPSPPVEIVISEHAEATAAVAAPVVTGQSEHCAPPVLNLEIDGFETWTVAGTEEEEEEAPPMQKSLLPERPTTLPHAVCADVTTNTVADVLSGEELVTPSSEEPSTPSAEGSPTKKKASKKTKSTADGKTKKSKKTKKCEEKENISVRSSFSKFDALSRKSGVLHVRSSDAAKAQQHFSQGSGTDPSAPQNCRACGNQVFQMEQVKAEKSVWHKNCFRCKECNKQLTVDTYGSNEGTLYCKPHFKDLFKPKAVAIEEPALLRPRRLEMIIRENQPEELPPDVVRASDKPDLGLEELTSLNVKSRYQLFERTDEAEIERSPSNVNVKRSPSILSKLARFQAKGMDVGVTDDSLNGIPVEQSSSEDEENSDDEDEGDDAVVKSRVKRERPVSFGKMDDVRSKWATGQAQRREEQREERKEEVQRLRSRLFMGKCGKVKEMYEQAVQESSGTKSSARAAEIRSDKARSIKERFEKGEVLVSDSEENDQQKSRQEDMSVFEAGISKKSRSLFLELDSAAKTQQQQSPQSHNTTPRSPLAKPEVRRPKEWLSREPSQEVVRAADKLEEVEIQTADISSRFKFFEGYREPEKKRKQFRITPPREGQVKDASPERPVYRDPDVVRAEDRVGEEELVRSQTASRMLNIFRQMEERAGRDEVPEGPKPLKRFTPPPDYRKGDSGSSDEDSAESDEGESDEEESDEEGGQPQQPGLVRSADKLEDDFLKQALSTNAERAKALRAKFEQWDSSGQLNGRGRGDEEDEEDEEREGRDSLESTSSLRARFESMSQTTSQSVLTRERPKVNRFV